MKLWFLVLALVLIQAANAQDSIHSISRGAGSEPTLIKMNSGEVIFVEAGDENSLRAFEMKKQKSFAKSLSFEENYTPSEVGQAEIKTIFNKMSSLLRRKSECSDRAHVWTYEENQRTGVQSEKAFLFLTDTYIKKHRFKWWFHVAPMFTASNGEKMVLDKQFFDHPVTFNVWKDSLVFSKRDCVTEFRLADYMAGADQTQDCYQKFVPMYYRLPGDVTNLENGIQKTQWNSFEVNGARARAFTQGSL